MNKPIDHSGYIAPLKLTLLVASMSLMYACMPYNSESKVTAPGMTKTSSMKSLDAGAALLQSRPPIDVLNAYLDGFHFYNGQMKSQMEAHHYCSVLNEEVIQCVIYDGNLKDAKLMGVEYIISEQLFANLPDGEKALWHSHVHEVKSGQLIAPGIPEVAEHALMQKLVHTYGKTWHTWHTDLDKSLPLGVPQLMMGFTADGQVDSGMVADRDRRFGIDSEVKRNRARILKPLSWPQGRTHGRGVTSYRSKILPVAPTIIQLKKLHFLRNNERVATFGLRIICG